MRTQSRSVRGRPPIATWKGSKNSICLVHQVPSIPTVVFARFDSGSVFTRPSASRYSLCVCVVCACDRGGTTMRSGRRSGQRRTTKDRETNPGGHGWFATSSLRLCCVFLAAGPSPSPTRSLRSFSPPLTTATRPDNSKQKEKEKKSALLDLS